MTIRRFALSAALGAAAATGGAGAAGDQAANGPQVVIHTSEGAITLQLTPEEAPLSVENFLEYTRSGHYDGTIFHRVIPGFMIQGGGMDAEMEQRKTRAPIENEADNGLDNARGTVAMARTSAPNSATSQFFINLADNDFLNPGGVDPHGYAVFGRVTDGMDVVDAIAKTKTTRRGGHADVPAETITIESIEVIAAP